MKKMMMFTALFALMASWSFAQPPVIDKYSARMFVNHCEKQMQVDLSKLDLPAPSGITKYDGGEKDQAAKRFLHDYVKNLQADNAKDENSGSAVETKNDDALKDQAAKRFQHNYQKDLAVGGVSNVAARSVGPEYNEADIKDQAAKREQHNCVKNLQLAGGGENADTEIGPDNNDTDVEDQAAKRLQHNCEKILWVDGNPPPDNVGLGENSSLKNVKIVNPVENSIIVRTSDDISIMMIQVYDSRGSLVINEAVNAGYAQIPAERLKTGMYFVKIYLQDGAISRQIYKV